MEFLGEGLQAGEGVAVVASTEHAAEMLQRFSRDDSLDADRFVKSVGKPIERIFRATGEPLE